MKLFELYAELGLDASKFSSGVDQASKKGKTLADNLKSGLGGAAASVGSGVKATTVMMGNLMADAVKKGVSFVKEIASTGIDYNATMETYVTNFTTMLGGSSDAAQQLTNDLQEMAAATPFAMSDLADASQTLLAFGQDSSTVLDTLQSLGDISMGDKNKLSSLTLAFAQASSAGKLMGQDLMQMINAGFNPLQTVVDKTGASMGDLKEFMSSGKASAALKKQMREARKEVKAMGDDASDGAKMLAQMYEDGAVSAETLAMIIAMETEPGGRFHNAMQNASQTFTGMISTLQDDASALMGKVFQPVSDYIKSDLLPRAQGFIKAVSDGFDAGGLEGAWSAAMSTIGGYIAELGPLALATGSDILANILNGLTGSQTTGAEISALISGVWTDAKAGLDALLSAGGGLLKGIYDGLIADGDSKTGIGAELSGIWSDASASVQSLIDSAGGLLGTIYTSITGQEATATNIGNTIGGVFAAGGTAISDLMSTASTFFTDLSTTLGDPDASIGEKIAGVFNAGAKAMEGLLESAGTFMTKLYVAITGDTEGAAKMQGWIDRLFETPSEQEAREETTVRELATQTSGFVYSKDAFESMYNTAYKMYFDPASYGITEDQADEWMTQLTKHEMGTETLSPEAFKQIADAMGEALQYADKMKEALESSAEASETSEGESAAPIEITVNVSVDGEEVTSVIEPKITGNIMRQFRNAQLTTA